jgi:transposase-like protein
VNKSPRKHTPEFKAKVALEALQGDRTLAELAAQYELHPKQIQTWRKQLLDNAKSAFESGNDKIEKNWQAEKSKLFAQIGKLTVERDFLEQGLRRFK